MSAAHVPNQRAERPWLFASSSHAVLEEELAWYFGESESASGISSNFEAMNARALSGRNGTQSRSSDLSVEDRMEAACAARTIERRLRSMQDRQAGILLAAFTPRDWPLGLEAELGPLTGIVVRLAVAGGRDGMPAGNLARAEAEMATSLDRALAGEGDGLMARLRKRAERLFTGALRSYAKVRGLGPSVLPGRS